MAISHRPGKANLLSFPRLRVSSNSAFKVVSSKIVLISFPLKSWFYLSALTVADHRRHCQTTRFERILTCVLAPKITTRAGAPWDLRKRIWPDGLRRFRSPVKLRRL